MADGIQGPLGRRHVSKIDLNTLWDFDFLGVAPRYRPHTRG